MKKTDVAILVDNSTIEDWQVSALAEAADVINVRLVINCINTRRSERSVRHLVYHLIDTFVSRNAEVARVPVDASDCAVHDFFCENKRNRQKLPTDVLQLLVEMDIQVIVRFGMDLLEVDESLDKVSVMSFHHGAPAKYRKHSVGFYELLNREDRIGIVVQELRGKPQTGKTYALAYSKIYHHSYKRTVRTLYSISSYLLRKAILNLQNAAPLDALAEGKSSELPSNRIAILFLAKLFVRKARLLFYGAFIEKKWQVATLKYPGRLAARTVIDRTSLDEVRISSGYVFYADPFFSSDGRFIRLEALKSRTGLGDIVEIKIGNWEVPDVILTGAHYSYPFCFTIDGEEFLLPEVASHSKPFLLNLNTWRKVFLKGFGEMRLLDATLFEHNGKYYLFFGEADAGNVLQLYCAKDIRAAFTRHPCSPIVIDPASARMGGRVLRHGDELIRFGQDNCLGYGARLNAFRITLLDEQHYEEAFIGSVEVEGARGPHTVDVHGDRAVIDYYQERFSLLAGYRRVLAKLPSRKTGESPAGQHGPCP